MKIIILNTFLFVKFPGDTLRGLTGQSAPVLVEMVFSTGNVSAPTQLLSLVEKTVWQLDQPLISALAFLPSALVKLNDLFCTPILYLVGLLGRRVAR